MPVIRTATTEGAAKGMVTTRAAHELEDQEVAWLQDGLVDQPGLVFKRNGVPGVASGVVHQVVCDTGNKTIPLGVVACYDPAGVRRIMIVWYDAPTAHTTDSVIWGSIYSDTYSFISRQPLFHAINSWASDDMVIPYFSTAMLSDGGCQLFAGYGLSGADTASAHAVWYGCAPNIQYTYSSTSKTSFASTGGSGTTLTASSAPDAAKVFPGAIINGIGIVKSVVGTTINLTKPYPIGTIPAATYDLGVTMIPAPIRSRGLITTAVSGGLINGYGTDFRALSDLSRTSAHATALTSQVTENSIGTLTTAAGTTATGGVTGSIALNTTLESYFAYPIAPVAFGIQEWPNLFQIDGETGAFNPWPGRTQVQSGRLGGLVCSYGGYTFWANSCNISQNTSGVRAPASLSNRVWIAGPNSPYQVEHGPDGTWVDVKSEAPDDSDIMAIASCPNGVIICKRRSTWFLSGTSPDDFRLDKILDDGGTGPECVINWSGGVYWCGMQGIWFFDGSSKPVNIIKDTIGNLWNSIMQNGNVGFGAHGTKAYVYRDHMIINAFYGPASPLNKMYSGNTSNGDKVAIVIYLPNNAATTWSNVDLQGFLPPGGTERYGYALLVDKQTAPTFTYYLVPLDYIMDPTLNINLPDQIRCSNIPWTGSQSYPSFYMETKRYDLGDAMNRKVWKGFAMESDIHKTGSNAVMKVDYVAGLNNIGTAITATFPDTLTGFKAQRIKFRARDQFIGFRIYEDVNNRPTRFTLAPWQMVYKPGRAGVI